MAQEIADSTLLDTWGSSGAKIEPDISKIIEGWQLGEQPPHEYMNWLQNTFGSKLNHILKNGVASWNNETEYLAGSSVQHNSNVWICKTTNTNSEPTDANANWDKIPSLEKLALTVDTIDDFPAGATTGDTCIVKDLDRGGVFIYDSSKVAEDNQGTNFTGWIRQYSGAVNVKWFGIKNDNTNDNTILLQSLFDLASENGWKLFFPNGFYKFSSQLVIRESLQIEGETISKSRSTTGDINDRGAIFKYTGASTSDYLIVLADPSPSTSVYMYGTHINKIRVDCGGSENGVYVAGINEFFNMEDFEVGNYTSIGLKITKESTTDRVSNQATFRRIKLVPSSQGIAQGLVTSYCHRILFESITVDMQESDSTAPIYRGFVLGKDTRNCVFINCYAENSTVGYQLGEIVAADNDTVIGNTFINPTVEAPEIEPLDTSVDSITGTIAFLVNEGVKQYSISNLFSTIQYTGSVYDYLLYDSNVNRGVEGKVGASNDKLVFHIASENKYGREVWKNDSINVDNIPEISDDEINLTQNIAYPSVKGLKCVKTNNTVATTITGFGDGVEGQYLELRIRDAYTSIDSDNTTNGDSILLTGATDMVAPIGTNSIFIFRKRGTAWIELSRMDR